MVGPDKNEEPRAVIESAVEGFDSPVRLGEIEARVDLTESQVQHYTLALVKEDRLEIVHTVGNVHLYDTP